MGDSCGDRRRHRLLAEFLLLAVSFSRFLLARRQLDRSRRFDALLVHRELFDETRVKSNVARELEVEFVEGEEREQRQKLLFIALDRCGLERVQVNARIARLVRNDLDRARRYQAADCLQELIAGLREVAATRADGAVDARVDLVVAAELGGVRRLLGKFKSQRNCEN